LVATSVCGFIPARRKFIIVTTFNDQAQLHLMARPVEPDAPTGVPGTADGRVDPDRDRRW
jgi:hypothetical protein